MACPRDGAVTAADDLAGLPLIVLSTSNRPDLLDSAMRRRLGVQARFGRLDRGGLAAVLDTKLKPHYPYAPVAVLTPEQARGRVLAQVVEGLFGTDPAVAEVALRDGKKLVKHRRDFLTGGVVEQAVAHAIARSHGALGKVEAALRAGLETFASNRELARILLLEAVSLGPAYEAKRAEIHERFAALIRGYLEEAAAEGSIPPLDMRVATLAWLGAVNEVVIQWLSRGEPDLLTEAVPALTPMLLRSIGARI